MAAWAELAPQRPWCKQAFTSRHILGVPSVPGAPLPRVDGDAAKDYPTDANTTVTAILERTPSLEMLTIFFLLEPKSSSIVDVIHGAPHRVGSIAARSSSASST